MLHQNPSQDPTFGYLSTVRLAELGYFGGYLILSALGRPLEFHCTAPVRPNRAQEILYGPTLEAYLLGEQIGGTLLARAKLAPRVILTDHRAPLCLRERLDTPIVYCRPDRQDRSAAGWSSGPALPTGKMADGNARTSHPLGVFLVGEVEFELPPGFESDRGSATEMLTKLAECVDLAEPFDRIGEAIREAQRIGSREQEDAHGHAA